MNRLNLNAFRRPPCQRRGVLLLIVLVLLVLFLMLGVSFMLTAQQWRGGATSAAKAKEYKDESPKLAYSVLLDLIRGPRTQHSSLQNQSFLEDMYGNEVIRGTAGTPSAVAGGQIHQLTVTPHDGQSFSDITDYYGGRVLTVVDGEYAGQSRHILSSSGGTVYVDAFQHATAPVTEIGGATVLINGRPFSGTGAGFNPSSGRNNAVDGDGKPYSLLIHKRRFTPNGDYFKPGGLGGLNEDYDAPDFNNPYLSYTPWQAADSGDIKPSFHDQAVYQYFVTNGGMNTGLKRKVLFRPLVEDNPGFDGSNPNFDPVNGPWDVDNDGDLINDSVWIDVGLPVMKARDGRLVRPLVAFLVQDLDGRVNLNTAGTLQHVQDVMYEPTTPANPVFFHGAAGPLAVPRGSGFGPAEINPVFVLDDSQGELFSLLSGANLPFTDENGAEQTMPVLGRYGDDGQADPGNRRPGERLFDDYHSLLSQFHHLGHFNATVGDVTSSNFGHDFRGVGSVGLDAAGNPYFDSWGGDTAMVDDPYEIDVLRRAGTYAHDKLFTPGELEAVLRHADADAGALPQRLRLVAPSTLAHSRGVTTMSFDLPSPGVVAPRDIRDNPSVANKVHRHVADILAQRLRSGGLDEATITTQVNNMLSREVLGGLRFNVNSPLGNGRDDNGNGVVDEPLEANLDVVYWKSGDAGIPAAGAAGSPGAVINNRFLDRLANLNRSGADSVRQQYAQYLYVLAMTLLDEGFVFPDIRSGSTTLTAAERRELTAHRVAQWAVNVVDFRDPDSIMTRFVYDKNPFNGWNTAVGSADRRVVWGVEAPALLLSESVAFHDRRVTDSESDDGEANKLLAEGGDPADADADADQWGLPVGSAFIELYSPLSPLAAKQRPSRDLFTAGGEVDVSKTAPDGNPVWRLAVSHTQSSSAGDNTNNNFQALLDSKPNSTSFQVEDLDLLAPGSESLDVERYVNLGGNSANPNVFTNQSGAVTLAPGQFLVVGPREETEIGFGTGAAGQRIELRPGVAGNQVNYYQANGTRVTPQNDIKPAKAMIASAPRPAAWVNGDGPGRIGFSVSEPIPGGNYYAEPAAGTDGQGWLYGDPVPDVPFDSQDGRPLEVDSAQATGTYVWYKTVFLQRLADPTQAYNGETNPYITVDWMPIDLTTFNSKESIPEDPADQNGPPLRFDTRERGGDGANNIWSASFTDPAAANVDPGATTAFPYALSNTLGYWNDAITTGGRHPSAGTPPPYVGEPVALVKPWLTWNNRPFASGWEVMNVPASSPGRLFWEYPVTMPGDHTAQTNPYEHPHAPFPHLLNFFHSKPTVNSGAELARLLEYLYVPSKFIGTSKVIDPANAATTTRFTPPYNLLPGFREPGKINLNTISDPNVLRALFNGDPGDPASHGGPTWEEFGTSRAGNKVASVMGNPFRSAASAGLDPVDNQNRTGAMVSIVRPNPSDATRSLFGGHTAAPHRNTNLSPYFRHENFTRLGNMTTTRSHCFAVWITLGYFEVEPDTQGQSSDGYMLGREYGSDTGEIKRTRAFAIVDRSIPVAFEPGQDNNVEDTILLWRVIE